MSKAVRIALLVIICAVIASFIVYKQSSLTPQNSMPKSSKKKEPAALLLTSSAFENKARIPALYTCDGKNVSPPLSISGVPDDAKSLALILDDPDAPMGTWDHWVVFDINPRTTLIAEGDEPIGIHGKGSGDNLTYMGPCPPSGTHRYFFRVYALDKLLALPEGSTKKDVLKAIEGHVLAQGELMGTYGRP